jgi:hypothetical protein
MAKRRSNARLFEADGYTFKCWIDPIEASEKYDRGELDLAVHPVTGERIGFRLREVFQLSDPTHARPSQSSISLSEMLLNVGLSNHADNFPSPNAVEAAQVKVSAWPFVWDEQATCVRKMTL